MNPFDSPARTKRPKDQQSSPGPQAKRPRDCPCPDPPDCTGPQHIAAQLHEHGAVVVPIAAPPLQKEWRAMLQEELANQPEVNPGANGKGKLRSGSGFGAVNDPSIVHGPVARTIRSKVSEKMMPVFKRLAEQLNNNDNSGGGGTRYLQQLLDRWGMRHCSQQVMPDSMHRDAHPHPVYHNDNGEQEVDSSGIGYGGWVQIEGSSEFSYWQGSHRDKMAPDGHGGFLKLSAAEIAAYKAGGTHRVLTVPSGCLVLFDSTVAHEVRRGKKKKPGSEAWNVRMYVGHRLSTVPVPLFDKDALITNKQMRQSTAQMDAMLSFHGEDDPEDGPTAKNVAAFNRHQKKHARKNRHMLNAHGRALVSPGIKACCDTFAPPPTPAGQVVGPITAFAYSMHKQKKYAWLRERYKPGLFGLQAWPKEPVDFAQIALPDPAGVARLVKVQPYTKKELAVHLPQKITP